LIEIKSKVRGDIDEELKFIESITEPQSIYPKILELHGRKAKRSKQNRNKSDFMSEDYTIRSEKFN